MNFIELIFGSTSALQQDLVRQIVEKRLRIADRKTNSVRAWSFEEIDAYCFFDNKQLANCQSLVSEPSKLTGQHLSRLAPLMSFEFGAVDRFLDNKENLQLALTSFLEQSPSWQKAVAAYVVSQCIKTL